MKFEDLKPGLRLFYLPESGHITLTKILAKQEQAITLDFYLYNFGSSTPWITHGQKHIPKQQWNDSKYYWSSMKILDKHRQHTVIKNIFTNVKVKWSEN